MIQRRPLTTKESASHRAFAAAKNKLVSSKTTCVSFMNLFNNKDDADPAEINNALAYYIESLAPHILTFKDLMNFIKVFAKGNKKHSSSINNAILYTLKVNYSLYQEPSKFRQILSNLITFKYPLVSLLESFVMTQSAFEYVSCNNMPDITDVNPVIILGRSIHHSFEQQLKSYPTDDGTKVAKRNLINHIAQTNAVITGKILSANEDTIKLSLRFCGKLTLMKFLHTYDQAYIRACAILQTAHDKRHYITVQLANLILPLLKTDEERQAVINEMPLDARDSYRTALTTSTCHPPIPNVQQSSRAPLRLFERALAADTSATEIDLGSKREFVA